MWNKVSLFHWQGVTSAHTFAFFVPDKFFVSGLVYLHTSTEHFSCLKWAENFPLPFLLHISASYHLSWIWYPQISHIYSSTVHNILLVYSSCFFLKDVDFKSRAIHKVADNAADNAQKMVRTWGPTSWRRRSLDDKFTVVVVDICDSDFAT